jgi:hypothetical protein
VPGGWAPYGGQSQVLTTEQDGSDPRLLGQEGQTQELSWGSALPGGDSVMTTTVSMFSRHRTPAMNAGRLVRVYRGGIVWRGTMAEPAPSDSGGWEVTAQGEGTYGNNFRAIAGGGVAGGTPASADQMINDARGKGLRWSHHNDLDGVQGMDLTQLFEKGSRTVTEALSAFTSGNSTGADAPITLTWAVTGYDSRIRVFRLPSVTRPTRLLISADPVGRTLAGYYNAMALRHQSSRDGDGGQAATFDVWQQPVPGVITPSIARHGRLEGYADYSNAGYMSGVEARNRAQGVLNAYEAIAYTQEFTATPGQVLTIGGSPVDLGTERAGEVYQVLYADIGAGGEVSQADQVIFVGGSYLWDDVAQAARITPYNFVRQDFGSLVEAMAPPPVMPTNLG